MVSKSENQICDERTELTSLSLYAAKMMEFNNGQECTIAYLRERWLEVHRRISRRAVGDQVTAVSN